MLRDDGAVARAGLSDDAKRVLRKLLKVLPKDTEVVATDFELEQRNLTWAREMDERLELVPQRKAEKIRQKLETVGHTLIDHIYRHLIDESFTEFDNAKRKHDDDDDDRSPPGYRDYMLSRGHVCAMLQIFPEFKRTNTDIAHRELFRTRAVYEEFRCGDPKALTAKYTIEEVRSMLMDRDSVGELSHDTVRVLRKLLKMLPVGTEVVEAEFAIELRDKEWATMMEDRWIGIVEEQEKRERRRM